ncbi:Uncharacterised protein [uncultured archaeon]|nr:Uncharacterised protein [uncultured archaeon]
MYMIRKIKTQEAIEKEKKRNQIILGIVMMVLIVLSSAGYAIMSRDGSTSKVQKVQYGNLVFTQGNNYWQTQLGNKILYFTNLPQNISNVTISSILPSLGNYSGNNLYVVNSNIAVSTLSAALEGIASKIQEACLINQTNCVNKDLPIKDCSSYVIVYEEATNTSVEVKDKCVYLKGDFFVATDKFVYRLFNIA